MFCRRRISRDRSHQLRVLCVAVTLAIALTGRVDAQVSTFDLSGTVKDDQGGVLPGVSVTVRNEETGQSRTVVTDEVGLYYFAALPPQGSWALSVELTGFTTQRREGLRFAANTKPIINVSLAVGSVAETVTVVGETALLDTGQAMKALSITQDDLCLSSPFVLEVR